MYEFSTPQQQTLQLQVDERGITFLYGSPRQSGSGLRVEQCWASIHVLLDRLRHKERYYSMDASLSVWRQGENLHVKFYALDRPFEDTLTFCGEAAARILCLLRNLPNFN